MSEKKEDFFKRKKTIDPNTKVEIPEPKDYDPTNFESDTDACGIDATSMTRRHQILFTDMIVDSEKENGVATVCKRIEEHFSKREIAYLMAKDLIMASYNQAREKIETTKQGN